jgi:hypothetical protein
MDPITAFFVNLLVGLALSAAGTLIQQATAPKQKQPGVKSNLTIGGAQPLSFIMGRFGSAGHLEYAGTWGSAGDTPNAYLTHVISFGDLPIRGYNRFFVYGEPVTLGDTPHVTRGYPVLEYRKGGKDHLWVRMYDGTQTTADPLLLSAFGSHPERPWLSDMIGRGVPYVVFSALVNRELFSGLPEYFAEVDGLDLGDEELNDNPIALTRKVLQGVEYGGEWVWGLQGLPAGRTPAANWDAELAKCNLPIDLVGGGTEPQFRVGAEITVDQQPIEVINDFMASCSGRIAEIGGVYKVMVGAPSEPVVSFTDEDIIITEGQSFEPFPGLESTYNGVNASYPEPDEKWGIKEAPALRDTDLEQEDDDRRLPATVRFPYVYSGTQVQRLMRAMHLESRRFRTHAHQMPPEFWEYEVLDAVAWDSDRNGYDAKVFLITLMDDLPTGNQFIGFKEQDASDYDWDADADEQPYETAPLIIARPAPQPMTGWSVAPYTHVDDAAQARRPGIEVGFAAGLVDVRAVRVQIRRDGETDPFFDGEYPYDPALVAPAIYIVANAILPNQPYEARGIYLPFSGRETEWSAWLDVTTPNVKLTAADIDIELDALAGEIAEQIRWIGSSVRDVLRKLEITGRLVAEQDLANFDTFDQLRRSTQVKLDELTASFDEVIEVALGPGGAIATALSSLYAAMGGNSAEVLVRWEAVAAPSGVAARWALQLRVVGEAFASAGIYLEVTDLGVSRIVLDASQTVMTTDSGATVVALFDEDGAVIRDLRVGTIEGPAGNFWNLTTGAFRVSGGS